jgi:intermediate peptidase
MSSQEERVAQLLIMDFKQSGIHMPVEKRTRFVELNDHVARLGQEFIKNSHGTAVPFVRIKDPYRALEGLSLRVIESISSPGIKLRSF